MSMNGDILNTILQMLGVQGLTIETDKPAAVVTLQFTRYGEHHQAVYTLKDLIEEIQVSKPNEKRPPPQGYTNLADVKLPSAPEPSSG